MNYHAILLLGLIASPLVARGQLEWMPGETPQAVFAGREQTLKLTIRNTTDKPVELPIRMRLFQLSSGSAMPVGDARSWKTLKLLPGQAVLEDAALDFPSVKARTLFEIRWSDAKGKAFGSTEVAVFPADLLKQLATLANDKPIGVLDSDDLLKPSLKRIEVEFEDLESGTALDKFDGPLAIVFSANPKLPQLRHLSERIAARAKDGVAIVWVHAASKPPPLARVLYPVRLGKGTVVAAPASTVSNFTNSPIAQLNLIRYAEIALNPDLLQLPETP